MAPLAYALSFACRDCRGSRGIRGEKGAHLHAHCLNSQDRTEAGLVLKAFNRKVVLQPGGPSARRGRSPRALGSGEVQDCKTVMRGRARLSPAAVLRHRDPTTCPSPQLSLGSASEQRTCAESLLCSLPEARRAWWRPLQGKEPKPKLASKQSPRCVCVVML